MGAFAENFAGGADGIAEVLDASYASGAQGGSVHDESVELDFAFAVEEGASAGVESVVVFHDDNGLLDGVEGGASGV